MWLGRGFKALYGWKEKIIGAVIILVLYTIYLLYVSGDFDFIIDPIKHAISKFLRKIDHSVAKYPDDKDGTK